MKNKLDIDRLKDIKRAIIKIEKYTQHITFKEFKKNDLVQDAVFKNLEIIGEAAYKITKNTKVTYQEIEWRKIESLRHKRVHDYYEIDLKIVWKTKETSLPKLHQRIIDLIKTLEATNKPS